MALRPPLQGTHGPDREGPGGHGTPRIRHDGRTRVFGVGQLGGGAAFAPKVFKAGVSTASMESLGVLSVSGQHLLPATAWERPKGPRGRDR